MTPDILVKNVALWGTAGLSDLGIANGRFVSIDPAGAPATAALTLDAEGRLAVPGFVEPHIHLDKALISERAPVNISGTLTEAIEILWEIKRNYKVEEIADRASRVLARALENGISRLRTHVDVDPIGGTRPAEGLIRARERFRELMDIQIAAFPQEGIVKSSGTEALMREVMKRGVDVVGGMPFNEESPADSRRHIEIVFEIAREFDADIDMHVDETDDPLARTLEVLAELTIKNGWQGRVTAGHTCALASYPRDYADHVIGRLREADINMIANPATNLMLQGRLDDYPKRRGVTQVKELLAAGVNVACGQDCVHDTFYPFGQNDPLEIAFLLCHASHMSRPAEIHTVMDMVTTNGARALRVPGFAVTVGTVADLVVLDARDAREALSTRLPRRFVIRKGKLIAESHLESRRSFDIPSMPAP
ncbi:amidohydrolase family protein [Bradyrhizobium sp.]|jgi:cytosine deaminase|uniref:amidohydrolase family protein n=1 Tax=Bradyrhizobium sp. TaxID=376 RepID=UPI003C16DC0A